MKTSPSTPLILASVIAFGGGCASPDASDPFDMDPINVSLEQEGSYGGSKDPPSGFNGMLPSEFWSAGAQTAMRTLGKMPLNSGVLTNVGGIDYPTLRTDSTTDLNSAAAAYPKVFSDLIQCALDPTQTVYEPVTHKLLTGWWGLAEVWLNQDLIGKDARQEWVTGCMLARLNKAGKVVDILLEGDLPKIQVTPVFPIAKNYNLLYPFEESALFGNLFTSDTIPNAQTPAFKAYVCRENSLLDACLDGGLQFLDSRICDNSPTKCGLVDVGPCDPSRPDPRDNCIKHGLSSPDDEHWDCKTPLGTVYTTRTVGVQLLAPTALNPFQCD